MLTSLDLFHCSSLEVGGALPDGRLGNFIEQETQNASIHVSSAMYSFPVPLNGILALSMVIEARPRLYLAIS